MGEECLYAGTLQTSNKPTMFVAHRTLPQKESGGFAVKLVTKHVRVKAAERMDNSVFVFLLTQVPPSLWLSITAVVAPSSAALRAPARPPDPPPITRKSNRVVSVAVGSEAMLRRITACLPKDEKSSFRRMKKQGSLVRVSWINIAITRKLAGVCVRQMGNGRVKWKPLLCHYELQQWCVNPRNTFHNSHGDPHMSYRGYNNRCKSEQILQQELNCEFLKNASEQLGLYFKII